MISTSTRLFVWLLCVAAATLAPFNFDAATAQQHPFMAVHFDAHEYDLIHLVLNALLFAPVGVVLQRDGARRGARLLSIAIAAGAGAFMISFGVESVQRFLPDRESSLVDLAANTVGAVIGVFAGRTWGPSVATWMNALRSRMSPAVLGSVMTIVMIVTLVASAELQARTRLANWSAEYPLVIGNEQTGTRPWHGHVYTVTITDVATPPAVARRFSVGESVILPGLTIAAFDLDGAAPYRDASGKLPDIDWTNRSHQVSARRVAAPSQTWLQTKGPATALVQRLRATNAFSLRIRCATDDANQYQQGPARILSNSVSPFLRNFTLGQQYADLVVRLRTPATGLNGYPLETVVPGVFSNTDPRDILVTYDGATLVAAVAQTGQVVRTELSPGVSLASGVAALDVHADHLQMYKLAYLAILFVPPGVLLGLFGRTRRQRLRAGAVYLLSAAVLLESALVIASGRAFDWASVGVATATGAIVLTLLTVALQNPEEHGDRRNLAWLPVQTSS